MFKFIFNLFQKAYDKKVSTNGLALFRVFWGIVLFLEVAEMRHFKELRFDYIPFVEPFELNFGPFLLVWQLIVILLIIGYKTKVTTIVNYIYSILFFGLITTFEYHMFYVYLGINFLLIFVPISDSFSLDNLFRKIKYSGVRTTYYIEHKTTVLYYNLIVLVGLGFVYADSVIYKLTSPTWMSGLGMWRPSVMSNFNNSNFNIILNSELLMLVLGYLTILFEASFIFLMWFKKIRLSLVIIGIGLHIGIFIYYPIPLFAYGAISLYILMIPAKFWRKITIFFQFKKTQLTFIYDTDCPLCNKTKGAIQSLDLFNAISFVSISEAQGKIDALKKTSPKELANNIHSLSQDQKIFIGYQTYIQVLLKMVYTAPLALLLLIPGIKNIGQFIYKKIAKNRIIEVCNEDSCTVNILTETDETKKITSFLTIKQFRIFKLCIIFILLSCIQLNSSFHSYLKVYQLRTQKTSDFPENAVFKASFKIKNFSRLFLGITNHPVFNDNHYVSYKDLFAVEYIQGNKKIWLPIIDKKGKPGYYNTGANWVNWTFRVNTTKFTHEKLANGLKLYTAFWLAENNIQMEGATFIIKHKPIYSPDHFVPNQLEKLEAIPWNDVGTFTWSNETPKLIINEEEITKYY
ncbi:DCC1-like thiol-disulfide oxidoreductase family protein [Crocinitomix catalasitica]|uniref:DCC1-like thiol-disulfide oxidoreductase family protein n=1 Tax=Crocinitomix catalasitica TaxID=184607 RepID=UPI0004895CF6|nr:DCC1-like thiol-disulfide oxidoreductase family protein [Crocinitomix catalasitica]